MPVPQLATKLRITKLMRPGISEDDVKSATEALKAAGRAVSIIAVREKLGGLHSAQCILCSLDIAEIELLQHQRKWHEATQLMIEAARSVEKGNADFDVE